MKNNIRNLILTVLLLTPAIMLRAADDAALTKYMEAEQASVKKDREALFNEALSLYLKVQEPSAELNYDIANCYYQLGEYGLAILYYSRALEMSPRFVIAKDNLAAAQKKIGLPTSSPFKIPMSSPEMRLSYLGLLTASFLFFSLAIFIGQKIFYRFAAITLIAACALLGVILYQQYLKPLEAIVIKPSPLRKDAGIQYTVIPTKNPIYGTRVSVIAVTPDGSWIKVRTDADESGYVSKEQARII
jgi:tetratricopeptide (TPR) repeat protein